MPAASALRAANVHARTSSSTCTSLRPERDATTKPIWPAPQHSSSTAPLGSDGSSSTAHAACDSVHGRGASTSSSNAISRPPKSTVATERWRTPSAALVEREIELHHGAGEEVLLDHRL